MPQIGGELRGGRRGFAAALVVVSMLALVPAPAHAYHRDRQQELERLIREKREKLERAEAQEQALLDRIRRSDERRATLDRQLGGLEGQLRLARSRLSILEVRLDRVAAQLRLKTAELERTLGILHEQTELMNARAASIFINAPDVLTQAVQFSTDFQAMLVTEQYTESVLAADVALAQEIQRLKDHLAWQRTVIDRRRAQVDADRRAAAQEAQRIAGIIADRARIRAAVQREISYRARLLDSVRDRQAAYREAIASYQRESDNISDFLRGRQAGQRAIQGRGGYLKWPVSGSITSGYGWRTHPVYGYRSFHTGIDIGAPSGRTIKAARAGTVLYTGYKGAYGLIVLIDHGNSLATLYAHCSKTYVSAGENVSTLESVAAVGSTGWSTGPHLHFEVRVNGEPTNPMNWL